MSVRVTAGGQEVVIVLLRLPGNESSSVEISTGGQEVVFALRNTRDNL